MSFLEDKKLEPKDGEIFKFTNPGERIHAEFLSRRTVKTKKQEAASVLDCNIIESRIMDHGEEEPGPIHVHTIFESMHIKQLFDEAGFQPGDNFILQFCSVTAKGFKKFALEKLSLPDSEAQLPDDNDREWFKERELDDDEPPPISR